MMNAGYQSVRWAAMEVRSVDKFVQARDRGYQLPRIAWPWQLCLGLAMTLMMLTSAHAHKPSDSYLRITNDNDTLQIEWDIALKDLEYVIGIDADQDRQITWAELKNRQTEIAAYALSRLSITADSAAVELAVDEFKVNQHSDGMYAVLVIRSNCDSHVSQLGIDYRLLFDVDPTHRGLVLFQNGMVNSTHVLSPSNPQVSLDTEQANLMHALAEYIREGIWHIWIGFDHILFLVSLLLPAVLVLHKNAWQPVDAFRPACQAVLKVVTVFTLAHSVTLWLSVMEYVTLPSHVVEATIAFSIVVTALNNLYPVLPLSGWAIAFLFGLIHGFGFANVLLDLGLSSMALGVSLFGFNVGVELGQLAIVLVLLPVIFYLRGTSFYRFVVLRGGSIAIAIIAMIWMYERTCNAEILGF